jgi:hypothetical protein
MSEERREVGRSVVVGTDHDHDGFEAERSTGWDEAGFDREQALACEHGHAIGRSEAWRGRRWEDVAAYARETWEQRRPGTWDQFEAAVRYGWLRATEADGERSSRRPG